MTNNISNECDIYASLASSILDLVSRKRPPTGGGQSEYREGFDTLLEGVDDEAINIIKKWVGENFKSTMIDAIRSAEFAEVFANVAFNTEINATPELLDIPVIDTIQFGRIEDESVW